MSEKALNINQHKIAIRSSQGWVSLDLHELWEYRDLLWFLTMREIKARYRQTALGPLWIILQPVGSMIIFTLIFGLLAKLPSDGLPYPLFSYSGLLPWGYFAGAVGATTASLTSYMRMISKVYFPRLVVPIVGVLSGLIDLVVSFVVLLGLMLLYGFSPTPNAIFLPLFILLAALTALAVGLWSAALAVRFRDVRFGVNYLVKFWIYATPVAYAASVIPERFTTLYQMNPMYWVVEGFRWGLLGVGEPVQPIILIPIAAVIVLFITGLFVFRRTEVNVVDWL